MILLVKMGCVVTKSRVHRADLDEVVPMPPILGETPTTVWIRERNLIQIGKPLHVPRGEKIMVNRDIHP